MGGCPPILLQKGSIVTNSTSGHLTRDFREQDNQKEQGEDGNEEFQDAEAQTDKKQFDVTDRDHISEGI